MQKGKRSIRRKKFGVRKFGVRVKTALESLKVWGQSKNCVGKFGVRKFSFYSDPKLTLWGITLIGSLSSGSLLKGIISGLVGLLIGTIGYSEAGVTRGTFGSAYLLDGVPVIPAMIGMFAASELFRLVKTEYLVEDSAARQVSVRQILTGFRSTITYPWIVLRGSLIGVFVGAVPGVQALWLLGAGGCYWYSARWNCRGIRHLFVSDQRWPVELLARETGGAHDPGITRRIPFWQ